jgi:glycosyltransferase involved in cell wall biosynthesis
MSTHHVLEKREQAKLISLVIPCYNEEAVIPVLKPALTKLMNGLACEVEAILINDGSRDATIKLLWDWATEDKRIKVIGFARNFGHQAAVTAGMDAAQGDAVVVMDADLQDPPEVVHTMILKYHEGYDIVYGQREEREGESWFKLGTAWLFYRVMRKLVHKDLPVDAGDFRLISRQALDALNSMRETHRFLRGMGAWVGFAQCPVVYKRAARAAGETKYPLSKMLLFAWTAAVSFSPLPLRLSLALGFLSAFFGLLVGIYAIIQGIIHFLGHNPHHTYNPGWATLVTLICLIGGTILICLGILGEYVGRVFEEVKNRPLYIVKARKNFTEN